MSNAGINYYNLAKGAEKMVGPAYVWVERGPLLPLTGAQIQIVRQRARWIASPAKVRAPATALVGPIAATDLETWWLAESLELPPQGSTCCGQFIVAAEALGAGAFGSDGRYVETIQVSSSAALSTLVFQIAGVATTVATLVQGAVFEFDVPSHNQSSVGCGAGALNVAWRVGRDYFGV